MVRTEWHPVTLIFFHFSFTTTDVAETLTGQVELSENKNKIK